MRAIPWDPWDPYNTRAVVVSSWHTIEGQSPRWEAAD